MADIISIDDKIALSKEKKDALIRKRKIQAVRKIFQCTQCAYKCEKCGAQLDSPADWPRVVSVMSISRAARRASS